MIEIITGENGHKIIRRDGVLTASRFDPRAEARAWVARRKDFLDKVKTVFVVGLGSGYHVDELCAATAARLLVVEPSLEVVDAVYAIHKFPPGRVAMECVQTARGLRASKAVRQAVTQSFVVLQHAPSTAANAKFFDDCHSQLLGRDWGSLTWQWQLHGFADLDRSPRVDGKGEPLTIYDLEQTELVQNSEERERLLIKALRDLVK